MDEPARKRRRTNSPEERDRQSSPLRKPPRRPSFASPTKASLARNYPNLLRPTFAGEGEASRPSSRGDILARGKEAQGFVLGETDNQERSVQQAREDADETTAGAQQRTSRVQNGTPPRARKVAGYQSAPLSTGTPDGEELDLPTTPSQRGSEEQDGPRSGVLFSSPSKRPPRKTDPVKQPPLRPKAPPVQEGLRVRPMEDGPDEDQNAGEKKVPPDPEVEKRRQEKARLQRELEELEVQVSRCTEELVKEQQRAPEQALRPSERGGLNDFIAKASGANTKEEQPAPVSSLLCSFLPFSALSVPQPYPKQPQKAVPSHQPLGLADPLPYLGLFTSVKFSTHLTLPRGKVFPSSKRVHQKHTIDIIGSQKLLASQISIIIDALANEIIDMHILRLSPWAERELGTVLRSKAKEKDLGNACWAIDSYWEIAQKRAQYWQKCELTYAHLIAGRTNEDTENVRPQAKSAQTVSRKDLNRHLGRDTLILQDKNVLLKLSWRISFDWTGEAESDITVEPAVPRVWQETYTAASLKKIPETFASLLRGKGAEQATRIMVALLFAK